MLVGLPTMARRLYGFSVEDPRRRPRAIRIPPEAVDRRRRQRSPPDLPGTLQCLRSRASDSVLSKKQHYVVHQRLRRLLQRPSPGSSWANSAGSFPVNQPLQKRSSDCRIRVGQDHVGNVLLLRPPAAYRFEPAPEHGRPQCDGARVLVRRIGPAGPMPKLSCDVLNPKHQIVFLARQRKRYVGEADPSATYSPISHATSGSSGISFTARLPKVLRPRLSCPALIHPDRSMVWSLRTLCRRGTQT